MISMLRIKDSFPDTEVWDEETGGYIKLKDTEEDLWN